MGFGVKLGEFRRRKGLSQEELSSALGVSRSFISHLERGAKAPPAEFLARLSRVLGLSPVEATQLFDLGQRSRRRVSLGRSFPASQVDLVNRLVRGMARLRRDQLMVLEVIVDALPSE